MTNPNHFNALDLPEQAALEEEQIKEAFQALAATAHPDQGGDEATFKALNTAYQTLLNPTTRLRHLLETHDVSFDARGQVDSALMDQFMPVGDLIQRTDAHLRDLETAASALSKALLTPKTMELQEAIEKQINSLDTLQSSQFESLANYSGENIQDCADAAGTTARNLAFLDKWKAQLRERYAQLFV